MGIKQKGAIHLLLPAAILIIVALGIVASKTPTTTTLATNQQVLGENETAKKEAEQQKESAQKTAELNKESTKINIQSEGKKSEVEIETSGGQKIKTKVEDDGKTKVEIEDEDKEASESADEDEDEIEDEDEEASGSADEDDLEEVRSISKFPLRIDLATNQLIMTKNGVERVLTVLPAKAVQNMLRAHLKKGLGPKFFEGATTSATPAATSSAEPSPQSPSATPSATPTEEPIATESAEITVLESQISLEEEDGQAVYKIPAKKHLKVLGLIPVTTDFTGFVSADTGALLKEQESLLSKILDLLSP